MTDVDPSITLMPKLIKCLREIGNIWEFMSKDVVVVSF